MLELTKVPFEKLEVRTGLEGITSNQNTLDLYKGMLLEDIKADLDSKRSPLVSIAMNLTKDFNKSSLIRANNAFLGSALFLVGRRAYNKVGSVGTYHYEHVFHSPSLEDVVNFLKEQGYTIFSVDNNTDIEGFTPEDLYSVNFPEKSAFLYGEEQAGLSEESIKLTNRMVYIGQRGSVRSLNVAQAGAVIMAEYSRQHQL